MSEHDVSVAVYLVLLVGFGVLEALARGRRGSVPRLAVVLRLAMRTRSAQIGLLLAWWWLGWHFILNQ